MADVMDAPVVDAVDSPVDDAVVDTGVVDDGSQSLDGAVDTPVDGVVVDPAQVDPDGRQIPADLRKLISDLKVTSPLVAKKVKDLFFQTQALTKEFPGGLKEVRQLRETLEGIGGSDGIQAMQTENAEWKAIDQQFMAGDPRFVDTVANGNPEVFSKLMPRFLSKYAEMDEPGYQRTMSQVVVNTLQSSGVMNQLYLIKQNLGMNNADEAKKLLAGLDDWFKGMETTARTAPAQAQVDPQRQKLDADRKALNEQQQKLFTDSVVSDFNAFKRAAVKKELAQHLKGKQIDDERYEVFEERTMKEIAKSLSAQPDFKRTFDKYMAAGDKESLLKFARSRSEALIPSAVKKVHQLIFGTAAPVKPGPKPNGGLPDKPAPVGWVKLAAQPRPEEIDSSKTTHDMIFDQKAVLRNGKKVTW